MDIFLVEIVCIMTSWETDKPKVPLILPILPSCMNHLWELCVSTCYLAMVLFSRCLKLIQNIFKQYSTHCILKPVHAMFKSPNLNDH